jgi:diguanylate cyclase (GGDEF)-like protein
MSEATTITVHSDDHELVERLIARLGSTPGLRSVTPPAPAEVILVDDRLAEAPTVMRRAIIEDGALCIVLSDGADLGRLLEVLDAGGRGCLPLAPEPLAVRRAIDAAARDQFELPSTIARALFARIDRAVAADEPPPVSRAVLEDVIAQRRFEMVFQPIVDLRSGSVVALEALARFTHELAHPPNVWLRLAEGVGLRVQLELELVRAALQALPAMPDAVDLSLNVSPAAAMDPSLADMLSDAPLRRIVLEISDHRQLDDYEPLAEALADLRAEGLRIAVDDSGQGLNSLQQVARLAPSFMKLNRTLTRNIDRDETRHALAYALAAFATQIGMSVIAEGLETDGELQALRALGAPLGQGYLLARPKPLGELSLSEAFKLPAGGGGGGEDEIPLLALTPRAREDFREACRGILRALNKLHPSATFSVAHLDYAQRRHRVIATRGPATAGLEQGADMRLEDSLCFHMASGRGSRVCDDVADDLLYGALPFGREHDVASYLGVPLELPDGTRVGSLFAFARAPQAFAREDLRLVDGAASMLTGVLLEQTSGMSPGAVMRFLRELACRDEVSGVLNAPAFAAALEDELRKNRGRLGGHYLSVSINDLDSVREQYGKAVGDLVVKDVAKALATSVDRFDAVGRVGDNHLAALLVFHREDDEHERLAKLQLNLAARLRDFIARREIVISVQSGAVALRDVHDPALAWDLAWHESERVI